MKRYNMIKNIMLASATAVLYWGYVLESVGIVPKVFGTLTIFVAILALLRDADKQFMRESTTDWAKRRERMRNEK